MQQCEQIILVLKGPKQLFGLALNTIKNGKIEVPSPFLKVLSNIFLTHNQLEKSLSV